MELISWFVWDTLFVVGSSKGKFLSLGQWLGSNFLHPHFRFLEYVLIDRVCLELISAMSKLIPVQLI